jgi:hypothetical protein
MQVNSGRLDIGGLLCNKQRPVAGRMIRLCGSVAHVVARRQIFLDSDFRLGADSGALGDAHEEREGHKDGCQAEEEH